MPALADRNRLDRRHAISAVAATVTSLVATATVAVSASQSAADPLAFPERALNAPARGAFVLVAALLVLGGWSLQVMTRSGLGLALAATATLVPLWSAWWFVPDPGRAWALALTPLALPGIALIVVGWPGDRHVTASAALLGAWALASAAVVVHLMTYNPIGDVGCVRTCADVPAVLQSWLDVHTGLGLTAALTVAAAVTATLAVLGMSDRPWPLRCAAVVAMFGLSVFAVLRALAWTNPQLAGWLTLLAPVAPAVVVAAAGALIVRRERARRAVRMLVERLSNAGGHGDVQYAVPGTGRWVDADGHQVVQERPSVVLADSAGPVLRLSLPPGMAHADVLDMLTPAAVLAMRNTRLSAAALARLADVRASQRRVVAASDAERHRIERDLHDGAQQRLVSVLFQLPSIRRDLGRSAHARLDDIEARLRSVLLHLRRLAPGGFPGVLAEEGLAAAIEELAAETDFETSVDVRLDSDLGPETERAIYSAVAAALKIPHARPGQANMRISIVGEHGTVHASVGVDSVRAVEASAFPDATDRVASLGGSLGVRTADDGSQVLVEVVIPCGS
jgi:signal transduction histidine kinase